MRKAESVAWALRLGDTEIGRAIDGQRRQIEIRRERPQRHQRGQRDECYTVDGGLGCDHAGSSSKFVILGEGGGSTSYFLRVANKLWMVRLRGP